MRKTHATLIAIHIVALAFVAYPYLGSGIVDTPEQLPTSTFSATSLLPTPTPNATANNSTITISFIHWDPHNVTLPTQLVILSPKNNATLPAGYVNLMLGVSSSKWLINGVFCTADWFSGPLPIWFYNLRSTETALSATVYFNSVPEGNHTLTVHANLHDGTYLTNTVYFCLEPAKSGER